MRAANCGLFVRAWVLAVASAAVPVHAETRVGETVSVAADERINEDLYAVGNVVRIDGVVNGDLVTAARTIEINGAISGDIMGLAGTTIIAGPVGGSARFVSGEALIRGGRVGEDVVAASGRLLVEPGSSVGRDLLAAAGELELSGPVGGDVTASADKAKLASAIVGTVKLTVDTLALTNAARIGGTLTYASANPAAIAPSATFGKLERVPVEVSRPVRWVGFAFGWLRAILAFTALGLLIALISPRFARTVPETLARKPWRSLGWGAVVLVAAPLVAVSVFAFGVVLGGWWLGLIAAGLFATALALSIPAIGFFLGTRVLHSLATTTAWKIVALVLGIAAITLVARIPFLGALIALGTILFGLGSFLLSGLELRKTVPAQA